MEFFETIVDEGQLPEDALDTLQSIDITKVIKSATCIHLVLVDEQLI